jgi:ubiquinone/menaquinone biosynthesis C-methylase UbiE
LKTRDEFFKFYLTYCPVAMSFWRSLECEQYARRPLPGPVLDVGCGDGLFALTVFGKQLEAGIDLDQKEVDRAIQRQAYKKTVCGSVNYLPFSSKSFKTVISNCVLEHVPDIDGALKEISRVLKPGGRLMITVPSECYNTHSFFGGIFRALGLGGVEKKYIDGLNRIFKHHHVDDAKTWEKRFKKAGLKLVEAEYFVSLEAFHAYERWLIPSFPAKIFKALFGRWIITPRILTKALAPGLVRKALYSKSEKGAAYFLTARKG